MISGNYRPVTQTTNEKFVALTEQKFYSEDMHDGRNVLREDNLECITHSVLILLRC